MPAVRRISDADADADRVVVGDQIPGCGVQKDKGVHAIGVADLSPVRVRSRPTVGDVVLCFPAGVGEVRAGLPWSSLHCEHGALRVAV
jgi:hypothetical protein